MVPHMMTRMGPSDGQFSAIFQKVVPAYRHPQDHPQHQTLHMHKTNQTAETIIACGLAMMCKTFHMH